MFLFLISVIIRRTIRAKPDIHNTKIIAPILSPVYGAIAAEYVKNGSMFIITSAII